MRPVLVDTSAWVEALREKGDENVRTELSRLLEEGEVCWNGMIRLELWNGVRDEKERAYLRDFADVTIDLRVTDTIWEGACRIAAQARKQGLTIPATDLLIFATAQYYRCAILHRDQHFDLLEKMIG